MSQYSNVILYIIFLS